ncbi:DNA helicase [Lithospermum erythrorhizon]|uniref:ATP-dependent DNA helicase n=1 Tax=Lithospermum erythrorhizon TaxID=34254 RepID=A0AAV3NWJ0_LITER
MVDKSVIQVLDYLLQELCENKQPFGGKLVVLGGDFRQVLPVVPRGSKKEHIEAKIGNGNEPTNSKEEVQIPRPIIIPYTSIEESLERLITSIYPDLSLFERSPFEMTKRSILCPKNEFVDDINSKLIERFSGSEMTYISDDRAKNARDQGDYVDYLNTLERKGLPQHKLILKKNSPIILLRNINPIEGLCNGTRLICKDLLPNVIGALIATGQYRGKHVWISRISLETNPTDTKYFVRMQIPVRLCFAMTINKSQGQTLDYVGLYLKQPVFFHEQLYVGLSRAKTRRNVKVLIVPPTYIDQGTEYTTNVV